MGKSLVSCFFETQCTDGLAENFFSTSGGPLRPEARGICHICHMVKLALCERPFNVAGQQRFTAVSIVI